MSNIAEYQTIKAAYQAPRAAARRFPLTAFQNIGFTGATPYLVKGMIPREGLTVIYGAPKCGKSFYVSHLALSIALGWSFRGHRVVQGAMVYIALEGERGISSRMEAFRREYLLDIPGPVPFYLLSTRLDLAAEYNQLIADIADQLVESSCVGIVIDTLNRSFVGSESSDQDMSAYIKAADAVRDAFRCAVIIVHHCGLDVTRPRGHTSLLGAADAQIAIKKDKDGVIVSTVEYMKDGEAGKEHLSRLRVVELGEDPDGDPITSCVIEDADCDAKASAKRKKLSPKDQMAFEKLVDCIVECGVPAPLDEHYPIGVEVVSFDTWRCRLKQTGVSSADEPATERGQWRRYRENLISSGHIASWNNLVWIIR